MKATTRLYVMADGKVGPKGSGRAVSLYRRIGGEVRDSELVEHPEIVAYVDPPAKKAPKQKSKTVETKPRKAKPRADDVADE